MNIEIADDILEKYRAHIKQRMLSDDVGKYIEYLIEGELRKFGAEGYVHDGLTGCKNRVQAAGDFKEALWGNGWNDRSIFRNQYLCIDIDKFYRFMDIHGLMAGDDLLKQLVNLLQEKYPGQSIYRYGGDEFIVEMKDALFQPIQLPEIEIKYSIINVEIKREGRSRYNFERFFDMYIEMGILLSSSTVTKIDFTYQLQNAG
jgi:diguanylate cyclase (GGDEF)-like protein